MNNWFRSRNNQVLLAIIIMMSVLVIRLLSLTVVQGDTWAKASQNMSIKNIYALAPRGEIKDRYGRVIAGNTPSFTVQLNAGNISNKDINKLALNLIKTLEANGDSYFDDFPIVSVNGVFRYTYQDIIEKWLTSQLMPSNFTADQAFSEMRRRLNIDDGVSKYDAQAVMQRTYNTFPPISVKNMKYLEELNKESFLQRYNLPTNLSANDAFYQLMDKYEIDRATSISDARKILIVRNELAALGYKSYLPAKIAKGISDKTIITLEEQRMSYPGVEIVAESTRYYPYKETAAHVIGYLGKISESEKVQYVDELGYNANDLIGKEGLEKTYETILKGQDGSKRVEVNAFGKMVRVISETPSQKGKDVYLTIDLELQQTAEKALKQALDQISIGGTFNSEFGSYNYGQTFSKANVGAVVALDVSNGDVLALASYPSYDPNLFANGISEDKWNELQSANPRDPLSPIPLFDVATRTAVQPGSTFKMVTGTAALESGLNPNVKLYDNGVIKYGDRTYACDLWNLYRGKHGYINFYDAIAESCNYYFFDAGTGYDFFKETSLNYKDPISITKITKYAGEYGLGKATGIEIPETVVPVPSEARKLTQTKSSLKNVLLTRAKIYFSPAVVSDKTKLSQNVDTIVGWTDENPTRGEILKRMETVGVLPNMISTVTDLCKYTYFNQAKWTTGDKLNISIGQGENAYTPIQMANYIATIANGGTLNNVSLIKGIEGQGLIPRTQGKKVEIDSQSLLDIQEAMRLVVASPKGTAKANFFNFPIQVAGKTGTAQRGGKINPPDEVEYIKTYLSRINYRLKFPDVEKEMNRLLVAYPEIYTSKNTAVRQAVINLSDGRIGYAQIDYYKQEYDNFAWFVSYAPADDPKIAVAVLIFQGGWGTYAAPVAKEVIAKYFAIENQYKNYVVNTEITK